MPTNNHSKQILIGHVRYINILTWIWAFQYKLLYIITDRHPSPLFSVCIISPNVERKIMQTNCVRKTGAVFFGSREIIRGNLTRAKSTRIIIETRCIIKPQTSCIIKNNAVCFSFNNAACFTCIYPLPPYFLQTSLFFYWLETTKNTTISIFNTKKIHNFQFPSLITAFNFRSAVVITTLFSEHFPSPSLVDTPIPERQLQHRVTHNYVKPKEVQRLTSKYLPSYSSDWQDFRITPYIYYAYSSLFN